MNVINTARWLPLFLFVVCAWSIPTADAQEAESKPRQVEELPLPPARTPPAPPAPVDSESSESSEQTLTPDADEPGYEPLMQGPVHEAFAVPIDSDPAGRAREYPDPPPEPILELPPEDPPEGKGLVWVPGYWAWSDEADKYVWVSGLYRKAPPGRTWVKGYWTKSSSGYRWTSGYWAAASAGTVATDDVVVMLPLVVNVFCDGGTTLVAGALCIASADRSCNVGTEDPLSSLAKGAAAAAAASTLSRGPL